MPNFTESWYNEFQASDIVELVNGVKDLPGAVMEIGCWQGYSTYHLANAVYPDTLICVDNWAGNPIYDENAVLLAKQRDVFSEFQANMAELTQENYTPYKMDCFKFLETFTKPVKFVHIDAQHDYGNVKRTIERLLPMLVPGAILCGDDFVTAHAGRDDLNGGVERAVVEMLPGFQAKGNLWFWKKESV